MSEPEGRGVEEVPAKRPAFEPPVSLVAPPSPQFKRPMSTTAGAALVLLRVAAGVVWMLGLVLGWNEHLNGFAASLSGGSTEAEPVDTDLVGVTLVLFLAVGGIVLAVEAVFGLLILRGRNFPRMIVMVISVLSISTAFVGWWVQGQDIRFSTTLVTLALDILVLLALSSRSAAAYARRYDRR